MLLNHRYFILFALILQLTACTGEDPAITADELRGHIEFLASDSLKGRYPGTAEDLVAAEYIAGEFRKAGLELMADNGLQAFEIITDLETGSSNFFNSAEFSGVLGTDFSPFPFSANKELKSGLEVAGYGFEISEEGTDWNDYRNIDVNGKWVLILRGNPELDSSMSVFHTYSNERDKVMLAQDKGAGGVLFVSGPDFDASDALKKLEGREGKVRIPVIHIKRELADRILEGSGYSVSSLESTMNSKRMPLSFSINTEISAGAEVNPSTETTYNIIACWPGKPDKNSEHIILGAHYDHLGMGGQGSSSRQPDTIAAHYGADDNASGVAALIEIAEKIASSEKNARLQYIFIAFGAEEMGLLGSKYYVENPMLPLQGARMMLNLDMVGRMRDRLVQVNGVGTALEFEEMVKEFVERDSLKLSMNPEGYGASDHSSFYGKDIPVLFFTTGAHEDYHKPGDTADKIKYDELSLLADNVSEVAVHAAGLEKKLSFREAGPKVRYTGRTNMKITLGIMPDFTDTDETPGMRVDFVTPGKPAGAGGMKKGDVIMSIEGGAINSIYDYMYRLGKVKKGQIIVVQVSRENQLIDLLVQL